MADPKVTEPGVPTKTEPKQEPTPAAGVKPDGNGDGGLNDLSADELVNIIKDTRAEAKTRRLSQRGLETEIADIKNKQKLEEQATLEDKQEFEKAYNNLKDETKDYKDLRDFKKSYLDRCKDKVDSALPSLTKAQQELFDISAKNAGYEDQLALIDKIKGTVNTVVDNTQATGRASDKQYTKDELLNDSILAQEVKSKHPDLYNKLMGLTNLK